jgi:DNA-binding transcriptional MerR regulator
VIILDELRYTIAEVSEMFETTHRSLRYYEDKIGFKINRDSAGNRVYSEHDIELIERLIDLKKKGLSLDGIKELFIENGLIDPQADHNIVVIDENTVKAKDFLIGEIKRAVSSQIQEEIEETHLKLDQLLEENDQLRREIQEIKDQSEERSKSGDEKLLSIADSINEWREELSKPSIPWYKKIFQSKKSEAEDAE